MKRTKNQGFLGYLATDCKAFMARIGAVSLPQSAWILQYEQTYKCFAAHCVGILQGRFSRAVLVDALLFKAKFQATSLWSLFSSLVRF